MPSRKAGNLIERRRAPSARSQPLRLGSAASTWSSVNTAMSRRYTVAGSVQPDRRCRCADLGFPSASGPARATAGVGGPVGAARWEGGGRRERRHRPGPRTARGARRRRDGRAAHRRHVALNKTTTLRAYRVAQTGGALHPNDHRALRWVGADELDDLPWVPADRAWVCELTRLLRSGPMVRPAVESDRAGIAAVIVEAYRHEFSTLSHNMDNVAAALTPAVEIDRFFVADRGGDILGAVACTDHAGRAMRVNAADWRRHLGVVRGALAARILARQ